MVSARVAGLAGLITGLVALAMAALMGLSAGAGDLVAYIHLGSVYDDTGDIHLLDTRTGRTVRLTSDLSNILTRLSWSKDGRLAWAAGYIDRAITLWDGKQVRRLSKRVVPLGETPVWSGDGRLAWTEMTDTASSPRVIIVWDGQRTQVVGSGYHPAWSKDGKLAWISGLNDESISVWDGQTASTLYQGAAAHSQVLDQGPIWSADGGRLAWISTDLGSSTVMVWGGGGLALVDQRPGAARWPVWSNDGRLAWFSENAVDSDVFVWDGQTVTNLGTSPADDRYPAWSPDGRLAWEARPPNGAWDVIVWDGKTRLRLTDRPGADIFPSWSKDNQLLWSSFHDGQYDLDVWDGQHIATLLGDGQLNWFPSWQDGPQIAWLRR